MQVGLHKVLIKRSIRAQTKWESQKLKNKGIIRGHLIDRMTLIKSERQGGGPHDHWSMVHEEALMWECTHKIPIEERFEGSGESHVSWSGREEREYLKSPSLRSFSFTPFLSLTSLLSHSSLSLNLLLLLSIPPPP